MTNHLKESGQTASGPTKLTRRDFVKRFLGTAASIGITSLVGCGEPNQSSSPPPEQIVPVGQTQVHHSPPNGGGEKPTSGPAEVPPCEFSTEARDIFTKYMVEHKIDPSSVDVMILPNLDERTLGDPYDSSCQVEFVIGNKPDKNGIRMLLGISNGVVYQAKARYEAGFWKANEPESGVAFVSLNVLDEEATSDMAKPVTNPLVALTFINDPPQLREQIIAAGENAYFVFNKTVAYPIPPNDKSIQIDVQKMIYEARQEKDLNGPKHRLLKQLENTFILLFKGTAKAETPKVGVLNGEYFYPLPDRSKIFAAPIAGCYQRIEDVGYERMVDGQKQVETHQRIKYYKKVTNKETGKEEEVWVADYLPNVTFEGKQTGGLVVRSVEALAVLNTELATIPEQQDKWRVLLPVDPRGYDPNKTVEVYAGPAKTYTRNIIHVKFDGRLPLTNILPLAKEIVKINHNTYGWTYVDNKQTINNNHTKIIPGEEMRYIRVTGSIEGLPDTALATRFGNKVGEINNHTYISYGSSTERPIMTGDDVLSGDSRLVDSKGKTAETNIPIFVAANE